MSALVLAVVNQKGGVGKTTTSVNLAAALAQSGRRVLLVDLDPQGNATMGSGVDKRNAPRTVYHVLLGLSELTTVRQRTEKGGYDLLPANRELAGAEVELVELAARETRLKAALERVRDEYDFVLIDCPPSLSLLTVNALTAAQRVLIPMQCEYYALEGLSDLVGTIKRVRANLNPQLEIAGLLGTMFDPRNKLWQSIRPQGLLQPVLVRPHAGGYELIAGERRWRAAQMAGLTEIPAVVREVPDESALVMALIENIQREDLNPMEQASAVQRLVDEFKMTHEQAACAVGRSRSATTNLLRLLRLPGPRPAVLTR